MLTIGSKIENLRMENQMTQKELAVILGVSPEIISDLEKNKSNPSIQMLLNLSRHFNLSVDELLGNQQTAFFDSLLLKTQERKELIEKFGDQLPDILPDEFNQKDH